MSLSDLMLADKWNNSYKHQGPSAVNTVSPDSYFPLIPYYSVLHYLDIYEWEGRGFLK